MQDSFNYKMYQVRPKQSVQNASSIQMEFTVPTMNNLHLEECYMECFVDLSFAIATSATGTNPALNTKILYSDPTLSCIGVSPNCMSTLFNNSDCLINNISTSYMKNIPQCQTVLRLVQDMKETNSIKNNSPLVPFSDLPQSQVAVTYNNTALPVTYGSRPNDKAASLGNQSLQCGAVLSSGVATVRVRLCGKIPSGVFYSDSLMSQGNNLLLTLNIDPLYRNNFIAVSSLKAFYDKIHISDSIPTSGMTVGDYYVGVNLTDVNFYMALSARNYMPLSENVKLNIKDINCTQKAITPTSAFDETFTLLDGCESVYIFTGTSKSGSGPAFCPTIFKTVATLMMKNLRVTYNGRQLNTPNYNLGYSDLANGPFDIATGAGIVDSTNRTFVGGEMLDWARAYNEFLNQNDCNQTSCPLDFSTWVTQPIFCFNIKKPPTEQGSELNIHFDMQTVNGVFEAYPCSLFVLTVRDMELQFVYDSNGKVDATNIAYVK